MKRNFVLPGLLAGALLFSTPVQGSDEVPDTPATSSEEQDSVAEVPAKLEEEVVVTATRGERAADAVPISVTVIRAEKIEHAAAITVDDFLREVPGIDLPLGGSTVQYPTQDTVSMRGLGGNRALVLLDGIPLNDPASGYAQWSKVPMTSIDRIEVARGAAASLFRNYSLGGTIQLFSRSLDDRVEGQVGYGSYGTTRAAGSVAKRLSDRFAIGVDAHISDSDGFDRVPSEVRGAVDIPVDSDNSTLQLRGELTTQRSRSFARASFFAEDLSLGTALSKNTRDILDVAAGTHLGVGSGDLSVTVFHQNQDFRTQNTRLIGRESEFILNRRTAPIRDTGAALQWSMSPGARMPYAVGPNPIKPKTRLVDP